MGDGPDADWLGFARPLRHCSFAFSCWSSVPSSPCLWSRSTNPRPSRSLRAVQVGRQLLGDSHDKTRIAAQIQTSCRLKRQCTQLRVPVARESCPSCGSAVLAVSKGSLVQTHEKQLRRWAMCSNLIYTHVLFCTYNSTCQLDTVNKDPFRKMSTYKVDPQLRTCE